ncbi:Uncharacterized protein FWK35_00030523, partial [Aphis craccivora]
LLTSLSPLVLRNVVILLTFSLSLCLSEHKLVSNAQQLLRVCLQQYSSITSRNNAPISNFGGGFQCKSEYPWCII